MNTLNTRTIKQMIENNQKVTFGFTVTAIYGMRRNAVLNFPFL